MTHTIDLRCPQCDIPLYGNDEVVIQKKPPFQSLLCKHCQDLMCLAVSDDKLLGINYYYIPSHNEALKANNG